jgi:P-loop Domain of unknown function (DUF2791)
MITTSRYLDVLEAEYLADFVPSGGAAVKFVAAADNSANELRRELLRRGREQGFVTATVDAANVKAHMIDKVFMAIAEQLDWDAMARAVVERSLAELGFKVPADQDLSLDVLAELNDYDPIELRLDLYRALQAKTTNDFELAQEFRVAMLRLCRAQVERSDAMAMEREAILMWLRGELRLISAVKSAGIFQRIARHNARHMLASLPRWVAKAGGAGLILDFDIRRCAVPKRPDDEFVYYTKASVIDVYELLRQLIDSTDELSSLLVLVTLDPDTLTDPRRGIEVHYDALKFRIWDEVRDRERENPLAALVRISSEDGRV